MLVPNRWYPEYTTQRIYKTDYPTPQNVLRSVVGAEDYRFTSKTVDAEYIRATAIMPRGLKYGHLTNTPWSLIYRAPEWTMIIVSVEDVDSWLDLARASGAQSWQQAHKQTRVYAWTNVEDDSPLKPLLIDNNPRRRKEYDRELVVDQLRAGYLTFEQIAKDHGVNGATIARIAKEENLGRTPSRRVKAQDEQT